MKKLIILMSMLVSLSVAAESAKDHSSQGHNTLQIPEDIRFLLRQEMNSVRQAMESLVFLSASGEWQEIEKIGTSIENTFIMKKTMSKDQMKKLHSVLPDAFKQLDKRFHTHAGKLAKAAREKDMELVQYYHFKMNQSCTSCHAQFAYERFTGFKPVAPVEHKH